MIKYKIKIKDPCVSKALGLDYYKTSKRLQYGEIIYVCLEIDTEHNFVIANYKASVINDFLSGTSVDLSAELGYTYKIKLYKITPADIKRYFDNHWIKLVSETETSQKTKQTKMDLHKKRIKFTKPGCCYPYSEIPKHLYGMIYIEDEKFFILHDYPSIQGEYPTRISPKEHGFLYSVLRPREAITNWIEDGTIEISTQTKKIESKSMIVKIIKNLVNKFIPQDEKDFIELGVKNECGEITEQGKELFFAYLWAKEKDTFYKDVVAPGVKELREEKSAK